MRFVLMLSIALNLLLLTTIVAARVDLSRTSSLGESESPRIHSIAMAKSQGTEVIPQLERISRSAGVAAGDIKAFTFGWLLVRAYTDSQSQAPRYWHSDYSPAFNSLAASMQIQGRVRDELIAIFGQAASEDPVFESIFKPLGSEYAFLSSELQLDLQARQLESVRARDRVRDIAPPQPGRCDNFMPETGLRLVAPGLPDLPGKAQTEYRLRFSNLAQQLREIGVATNEQEFRHLFNRLAELDQNPSPAAQARIRRDIREIIGSSNFDRFWSKRDPFFEQIEGYLRNQNLPQHQIDRAYSIINRTQDEMLAVIGSHPNQTAMLSAIANLRHEEISSLSAVLGRRPAEGLSAVLARAAIQFSSAGSVTC